MFSSKGKSSQTEAQNSRKKQIALERINMWEKRKKCFPFEAQIIIMSSELYNICKGKIIPQYPKVHNGVNGFKR